MDKTVRENARGKVAYFEKIERAFKSVENCFIFFLSCFILVFVYILNKRVVRRLNWFLTHFQLSFLIF